MRFHLTIQSVDGTNQRRSFDQEHVDLGAHPNNAVVLPHDEVSRRHALIERRGSTFKLLDRDSTNGTELNGSPIVAAHALPLAHGDSIQIGPFLLVFECPDAEAPFDTMRVVDTERAAARVRAALLRRHAELSEASDSRREVLLQAHLEETLSVHRDAVKLEILSWLGDSPLDCNTAGAGKASEAKHTDSGTTSDNTKPDPTSSDPQDQHSDASNGTEAPRIRRRREAAYVASQAAMERLARRLLDRELTTERQIQRFSRRIEILAETMLEWLPELLAVRRQQQERFGVDHIDLLNEDASPLGEGVARLPLDPKSLRRELLEPTRDKDLSALRVSLRQTFRDLFEHQQAYFAAMEASNTALVQRLAPEAIVAPLQEDHSRTALWAGEKSPQWRAFLQTYERFIADGLTEQVVLEAFQRGYLAALPVLDVDSVAAPTPKGED